MTSNLSTKNNLMHNLRAGSMTADDFALASKADSTILEYSKDVNYYVRQGGTLPASVKAICDWMAASAVTLAPATIHRRMISLHNWHKDNGYPSPLVDPRVKKVFSGITRTLGLSQRAVSPLVRDDLLSVLDSVRNQSPVRAARDTSLLLIMFSGALRRSSLISLTVADVIRHEYGIDIRITKSKTDQMAKGTTVSIPFASGAYCPIKALDAWLAISGIEEGFLLRSVDRHDRVGRGQLDASSVCRIVKKAVDLSGRNSAQYSSHSLRSGFVTSAAASNMPIADIAQVTKHRGIQSLQKYLRVVDQRRIRSLI